MTEKTYNNGPPEPGAWKRALEADPRITHVSCELEQLFAAVSQVSVGVATIVDKSGTMLSNLEVIRRHVDQMHERISTDEKDLIAGVLRAISRKLANDNRHGSEWLLMVSAQFASCDQWTRNLLQEVRAYLELERSWKNQ